MSLVSSPLQSTSQIPKIAWRDLRHLTERHLPVNMALITDVEKNGRTIGFAPNSSIAGEKPIPLTYTAQVTRRPRWYSMDPAGAFLYVTLKDEFTGERSRFEYDSNNDYANFTYMPVDKLPEDDKALTIKEDKPTLSFTSHYYSDGIPATSEIDPRDSFWQKGRKFTERVSVHYWGCLIALDELKNRKLSIT